MPEGTFIEISVCLDGIPIQALIGVLIQALIGVLIQALIGVPTGSPLR